jgi:MoaA/NifB/PqqE/SkfB family radical SAM enzyme
MCLFNLNLYRKRFLYIITRVSVKIRTIYYKKYLLNIGPNYYQYNMQRHMGPQRKICFAPEKSMYFHINGVVTPCSRNRSHVLGKFPEITLKDIWQSGEIKELNQKLKKNDFSLGCFYCENSIVNGNFASVKAQTYDHIPKNKRYPAMIDFALSSACNLNCIMCSNEYSTSFNSEQDRTLNKNVYDENFIKQLEEFIPHLYQARFFGGEPFLIPIYYTIWKRIVEINPVCKIIIQTNATILNDRIKKMIIKGNYIIDVSIDSFNKTTYEKIRQNANFDKVMQNVHYFAEHAKSKNNSLGIAVCPIKQNWEELPEIVLRCNELNAHVYFNPVWLPAECSLFFLSYSELQQIHAKLIGMQFPDISDVEKQNKYHFKCFLLQLNKWQQEKLEEEAIWKQLKIDKNEWPNIVLQDLQLILIQKTKLYLSEKKNASEHEISTQINKIISVLKRFNDSALFRETLLRLIEIPSEAFSYDVLNELTYRDPDSLEEFINSFSGMIKRNFI